MSDFNDKRLKLVKTNKPKKTRQKQQKLELLKRPLEAGTDPGLRVKTCRLTC